MASYYDQKDLTHFSDIGKDAPELWNKFLDYYNPGCPTMFDEVL